MPYRKDISDVHIPPAEHLAHTGPGAPSARRALKESPASQGFLLELPAS